MKTILAWVVVASLAAVSCTPLKDVIWPTTVKCFTTPSAELVAEVRAIVEQDGFEAAFSSATVGALEDVARRSTPEIVACILRELLDGYTKPTGMAAPPDDLARARRVQRFFIEHDIEARGPDETEP